jgi:opacity protein-like surface antigen
MKSFLQIALLIVALAGAAAANDVVAAVPEVNAGSAMSVIGLLGGVFLIMRARRK